MLEDDERGQELISNASSNQAASDKEQAGDSGAQDSGEASSNPGSSKGGSGSAIDKLKDKAAGGDKGSSLTSAGGSGTSSKLSSIQKGASSFISKNKTKLIIGGAGGLAGLLPILMFIAFLSLFKLNDIEKLYMDWQYQKINRAIGARTREMVREAKKAQADKAKVNDATTEVNPSDPVETELENLNTDQLDKMSTDPAKASDSIKQMEEAGRSVAGVGGELDSEFGVERTIGTIDETKSEEEILKETKLDEEKAVRKGITPSGGNFSDVQTQIDSDVKAGFSPEEAAARATKGIKIGGIASDFSTVNMISTFYCLTYDIFKQTAGKIGEQKVTELVRMASRTFTAADAQKLGKLTAKHVGAYNNLYDSGGKSFTQSAAYLRATHQTPDNSPTLADGSDNPRYNPDLSEIAKPFAQQGGLLHKIFDLFPTTGLVGAAISAGCGIALNNVVQIIVLVGEFAAQVATGVLTGGIAAGGEEAVQVTIKGVVWASFKDLIKQSFKGLGIQEAFKYVVAGVAANLAGASTSGTEDPIQRANKVDAGTDIMANESARLSGGRQLTTSESVALIDAQTKDTISHETLADKFFNIDKPTSVGSMMLAAIPTSPMTALNSIAGYIGSIFSPTNWLAKIFSPSKANADAGLDPYGIPQYGFTDAELSSVPDIAQNAKDIESNPDLYNSYQTCFAAPTSAETGFFKDASSPDPICNNPSDTNLTKYRVYRLDKEVIKNFALTYNKTPDLPGATAAGSAACTANSGCNIFLLGDSITVRANGASPSISSAFSTAGYTLNSDGSVGRSIRGAGQLPTTNALQAVDANKLQISSAQVIIIELGTNFGNDQGTMEQLLTAIKTINSTAKLYWVNVGAMGYSANRTSAIASYNTENTLIARLAPTDNYTVIDWCSKVFGGSPCTITNSPTNPTLLDTDGVHPSQSSGMNAFIKLLLTAVQGSPA